MNGIQRKKKCESARTVTVRIGTKKERNDFYVYVYLDPRRPGKYKYGKYKFNFEPFYVGKGSGGRDKMFYQHKHNPFLKRKLKKTTPIIIKAINKLTEKESFLKEISLISVIGRSNLKKGPLCNITEGGEGASGAVRTKKFKENLSSYWLGKPKFHLRGRKQSEETIQKRKESNKGFRHTEKTKKLLSKLRRQRKGSGYFASEETRKRMSIAHKGNPSKTGMKNSEETRRKISEAQKGKPKFALRGRIQSESEKKKRAFSLMKIKPKERNLIKTLKGKKTTKELAFLYGVHRTTIGNIRRSI